MPLKTDVDIHFNFDPEDIPKDILRGIDNGIDGGLGLVEKEQNTSYTATGKPARPRGSDYVRTFKLFNASERIRPSKIKGIWKNRTSYAVFVLGKRRQQARIHRNRWKDIEKVIKNTQKKVTDLISKRIGEELS